MNTIPSATPDKEFSKHKKVLDPKYDKAIDFLADAIIATMAKGIPLYQVSGSSREKLEDYYTTAYNLYTSEKYDKAKDLFSLIALQNHNDKKSWMGLAGCCQMLQQYPQALTTYAHIKLLDPSDPLPSFHSFTCYMELKKYPEALASLEAVILKCLKKPEYSELKEHAESLKKVLLETIIKNKK